MENQDINGLRPYSQNNTQTNNKEAFSETPQWLRHIGCYLFCVFTAACLIKTAIKALEYFDLFANGHVGLDAALFFGFAYVGWHLFHDFVHCREAVHVLKQ